jgi:uncharacterized membrane protein YcfT
VTEEVKPTRTRRTLAERKLALHAALQSLEAKERAEVLRLVADAHDTLKEAMTLNAAKPHIGHLQGAVNALLATTTALCK